ncbi:hypothetical protein CEB3_c21450 [Peptococcaceae bacterium CEB3]|nr:hypothetical protein CEB3_c21450 [Peptococcaceae bacterium CEB3]
MGFTFVIQVPWGMEAIIAALIVKMLDLLGNPGIVAVHAFESSRQVLDKKGLRAKRGIAKLSSYIFVTTARTDHNGKGMDPECYQWLKGLKEKGLPFYMHILHTAYIEYHEWKEFQKSMNNSLEPEVDIVLSESKENRKQNWIERVKGLKEYWNCLVDAYTEAHEPQEQTETNEPISIPESTVQDLSAETMEPEKAIEPAIRPESAVEQENRETAAMVNLVRKAAEAVQTVQTWMQTASAKYDAIANLVKTTAEALEEKAAQVKDEVVLKLQKLVSGVKIKTTPKRMIYTVPQKLFDMLDLGSTPTVQMALLKLTAFLKFVKREVNKWQT